MPNTIPASTLQFLKDLAANNDRDWFNSHKKTYQAEHAHLVQFADALIAAMNTHDNIETPTGKKSLMRIYRDTRFSKDKSPYKTYMGGGLRRATELLRGGYYYHIQPGASFVGGGFWGPNPEDLKRIRQDIAANDQELRAILQAPAFVKAFGTLQGETVKTAPKGFAKDHPAIDLIRHKQFVAMRPFSDAEVKAPGFLDEVVGTFVALRPFFDYMSEVLTTDANGNSLY